MKNKPKKKNFLFYLCISALVAKLLFFVFGKKAKFDSDNHWKKIGKKVKKINCNKASEKHTFRDFLGEEEKEIEKFIFGKESFKEFFKHTSGFFKDLFIPHTDNNHKPKMLRTKSLIFVVLSLLTIKIFLVAYLFLAYPDNAFMSENLTGRVIELINIDRAKNNIELLVRDDELSRAAKAKAEDMLTNNYFDHYGVDGKKPWEWIHRTEYDYIYAGENLAMNFTTAESVHAALMNSESHKKNILSEKYMDIGVAMVSGEINGKQTNILVQTFGHKRKIVPAVETIPKIEEEGVLKKEVEIISPQAIEKEKDVSEEILLINTANASTSASSSPTLLEQIEAIKKVSIIVRNVTEEKTEVMAEKNYLEIDNDALVTVRAAPEIIGGDAIMTHNKMKFVNYAYILVVSIIGLLLAINIFVKIKIQHKSVIIQTIFTIIFIVSLVYLKFHYLEGNIVDILLL